MKTITILFSLLALTLMAGCVDPGDWDRNNTPRGALGYSFAKDSKGNRLRDPRTGALLYTHTWDVGISGDGCSMWAQDEGTSDSYSLVSRHD